MTSVLTTNIIEQNSGVLPIQYVPSHIHKMALRLAQLEAGHTYMIVFTPLPGCEPTWSIIGSGKIENSKQILNKT